ncbi:rhodanese-like domain-containing protein [Hyphomonas sp. WL0036]|uniref:rhodanese-like domain-containing protein n=1 Tax=Hyphomonas sediminis TaxID=2866160 RepID=UPI001C815720|nr:rhodanese-like domain-containing protein [Hyphomonas sediminis]MBY9068087.1 rhodanese-like domain-containing protein [Hyphomonas sediminis]
MSDPRDLDSKTVFEALKRGDVLLVDVREPTEFANQRIHGALLHPLSTFEPRAIPANPGRQIVFQCGSGKRSRMALDKFMAETGAEAAHLAGGIAAWRAAGLPCVSINPATGQVEDHGRY